MFPEPLHAGSFTYAYDDLSNSLYFLQSCTIIHRPVKMTLQLGIDLRSQLSDRAEGHRRPTSCGIKPASKT